MPGLSQLMSHLSGIILGLAVIGLGRVEVLDQVVPHVEFPDDLFGPVDLDHVIRPHPPVRGAGIAALGDALLRGFVLPAEDEHVAGGPGARGDRMVLNMGRVIELVLPDDVPVPVELLEVAAMPAADVQAVCELVSVLPIGHVCCLVFTVDGTPGGSGSVQGACATRRLPFGSSHSCSETT